MPVTNKNIIYGTKDEGYLSWSFNINNMEILQVVMGAEKKRKITSNNGNVGGLRK